MMQTMQQDLQSFLLQLRYGLCIDLVVLDYFFDALIFEIEFKVAIASSSPSFLSSISRNLLILLQMSMDHREAYTCARSSRGTHLLFFSSPLQPGHF